MKMRTKDYILIADGIKQAMKDCKINTFKTYWDVYAGVMKAKMAIAAQLSQDNPKFDFEKFDAYIHDKYKHLPKDFQKTKYL